MNDPTGGIVLVSDASLGYGSPQIPAFTRSLSEHYGLPAVILEPDTPGKPPRGSLYADLGGTAAAA